MFEILVYSPNLQKYFILIIWIIIVFFKSDNIIVFNILEK